MEDLINANGEAVQGKQILNNIIQVQTPQQETKPIVVIPLNEENKKEPFQSLSKNSLPINDNRLVESNAVFVEKLDGDNVKAIMVIEKMPEHEQKKLADLIVLATVENKNHAIINIFSENYKNTKDVEFFKHKEDADLVLDSKFSEGKIPAYQTTQQLADAYIKVLERQEEKKIINKNLNDSLLPVVLIPLTDEQKIQVMKHLDGQMFFDLEKNDSANLSPEQYKSIPDSIDENLLHQGMKYALLTDRLEFPEQGLSYSINDKNQIERSSLVIDELEFKNNPTKDPEVNYVTSIVKMSDVTFDSQAISIDLINNGNLQTFESNDNNKLNNLLVQSDDILKVIPITEEQMQERLNNIENMYVRKLSEDDKLNERLYSAHGESGGDYPLLNVKDLAADIKLRNTTIVDYNFIETIVPNYNLTEEQINSIPDKINGFDISNEQKIALYNNDLEYGNSGIKLSNGAETITLEINKPDYAIYREIYGDLSNLKEGNVQKSEVEYYEKNEVKSISKTINEPQNTSDQTYITPITEAVPINVLPLSQEQKEIFKNINVQFSEPVVKSNIESIPITIIPLTQSQKDTYASINKDFEISNTANKTQHSNFVNALSHKEAIDAFAKTIAPNLSSVPDHMDGQKLSQDDKLKLLTSSLSLYIDEQGNKNTYTLNEKNQIVRTPQFGGKKGLESIVTTKDTIAQENPLKTTILPVNSSIDTNSPASFSTKTIKQDNIKDFLVVPNINIVTGNNIGESFLNSFNASFSKNPGTEHTVTTESNGNKPILGLQAKNVKAENSLDLSTNGNDVIKIVQIPSTDMSDNNKNVWKPNDIKWSSLEKIGITQKTLTDSGDLDKLLNGQRTSLLQIKGSIGDVKVESSAKLRLVPNADGEPKLMILGPSKELEIKDELFGYKFTQKEKEELKEKGRLKEPVKLVDPKTKKTGDFYIGVDVELNKVVVIAKDAILQTKSLEQLNGVKLSSVQQDKILSGTDIKLDNKPGSPIISGKIDFSNNSFKIIGTSSHVEKQTVDSSVKQDKTDSKEIKQPKEKTGIKFKM